MMLDPSIDQLLTKINSKYTLVTLSSRRARQIREENIVQIEEPTSATNVGIALEEIYADKLTYISTEYKERR
ncbi:DNA-directed RNA polymerase subunit omega [Halolactibacillus alkaliphilus]|uniref:DNA-directed RNA polymerase subunit omega n=1 Tax=Halolactibacillus alkaliphilus TaxID=442899 RepID=A0A511WX92_9BACI|nr:DNA-directed RNA polymerase subunit omega [Halolactibacillus alkaliphilus]GEN55729.1 DNA-directed RNA polymerase subunit omega [Halolactibacillus alkaliphilus]GGN65208.1 DNA-directed RNA polymerase subunit omega [Halolactibacillus alkaliphilus]SFO64121.1 DNA-directed RNA polymerase subunit omega [Halolactibacillus alkaliphilus]